MDVIRAGRIGDPLAQDGDDVDSPDLSEDASLGARRLGQIEEHLYR